MRLPGRLSAAIEVLADLEQRKRPASDALRDWGLSHRFAGSGDRAAIGNLVYDALRKKASHAYAMQDDSPRAVVLSVAVRDWGETTAELNASFAADQHAPAEITEAEIAQLTAPTDWDAAPEPVRADMPEWLAPSFQQAFGDSWVTEGQGLTARPPVDLRINGLKSEVGRVVKSLRRFEPQSGVLAPNGLRMAAGLRDARTPNVMSDEAYLKGWFEVQDQGSQLVAKLANAQPGQQVLDLCAGAGGKTLAMAADMQNKGQIFSYDSERARLAPIYDRIKRAGVRNVQVRAPEEGALDDLTARMDLVLVDAPCTGTGTWRRRPDAKWRLSEDQLQTRLDEQAAILKTALTYVKPGGRLAYITCSLLPQENDQQIASLLAENADFSVLAAADVWQSALPDVPSTAYVPTEHGLMLTPATTGTDGFFISVLTRSKTV